MGFPSRWFYYTAIMVLQLFTIKLNTEYYFTVDIDLLALCSSLTVLRVRSQSLRVLLLANSPKSRRQW
jgi:hypothetical protein